MMSSAIAQQLKEGNAWFLILAFWILAFVLEGCSNSLEVIRTTCTSRLIPTYVKPISIDSCQRDVFPFAYLVVHDCSFIDHTWCLLTRHAYILSLHAAAALPGVEQRVSWLLKAVFSLSTFHYEMFILKRAPEVWINFGGGLWSYGLVRLGTWQGYQVWGWSKAYNTAQITLNLKQVTVNHFWNKPLLFAGSALGAGRAWHHYVFSQHSCAKGCLAVYRNAGAFRT